MQVRLRMPVGTRIERTEDATKKTLQLIDDAAGKNNVAITSAFVGLQPPTYAINPIFLYTSGPDETSMGINISKHFNLRTDYIYNDIRLPEGDITTHELAQYIHVAINPRLDMAMFVQWNSLDDLLLGNFRLHWIPNIGSDLYVVYNRGYNKLDNLKFNRPGISSGAVKLVWRFTF